MSNVEHLHSDDAETTLSNVDVTQEAFDRTLLDQAKFDEIHQDIDSGDIEHAIIKASDFMDLGVTIRDLVMSFEGDHVPYSAETYISENGEAGIVIRLTGSMLNQIDHGRIHDKIQEARDNGDPFPVDITTFEIYLNANSVPRMLVTLG